MEISWLYTLIMIPFSLLLLALKFSTKQKQNLPPTPFPSLPLFGHLYLLKRPLHRTYHRLSQKLGPIFSLRFGNRLIVVVSNPSLVEECFTKNDIILANRPHFLVSKYLGYNYTTLIGSPYGEHWRNLRRLTATEIFSSSRLDMFQSMRQDEIRLQIQKLCTNSHHEFARVELRHVFSEMAFNIIMRMVAGKRYFGQCGDDEEAKKFRELIGEAFKVGGVSNLGDFFPVFRWVDYKGCEKNLAKLSEKMDLFLQNLVDNHKGNKSNSMIDHLLSLQESQPEYYSDIIIKGIIMVMLLAGTDTVAVTIEWAMSALLNHPEKLQNARSEVDSLAGNDRLVDESDLPHLPYLQNIINETFRLFPAAPLLLAHEASSDCKVGGYDIPRGTILQVNAFSIHRDPTIWDNPTGFWPERFEVGNVESSVLIPFGTGRRSCPGNGLAQRTVALALGSLIQCLKWERIGDEMIDLTEGAGVSMPKAVPLEAMCKVRDVMVKVLSENA